MLNMNGDLGGGGGGAWNGAAERRFDLHLARFGGCEVPLLVVVRGI